MLILVWTHQFRTTFGYSVDDVQLDGDYALSIVETAITWTYMTWQTPPVYCFHVDPLGRPPCLSDSETIASRAANSADDVMRPEIHEAGRQLYSVHNFDNHDVNYNFVNDRGPM